MREHFYFINEFGSDELEFFDWLLRAEACPVPIFENINLKQLIKAVLSHNSSLREYEHKNCAVNCPLGNRFVFIKVGFVEPRKVIFVLLEEGEIVP